MNITLHSSRIRVFVCGFVLLLLTACNLQSESRIVYVTTTPQSVPQSNDNTDLSAPVQPELSPVPMYPSSQPTPNPPRFDINLDWSSRHVVQPGDNLYYIALNYGTSLDSILELNQLDDPDNLFVGQEILLPGVPGDQTSDFKIIPDSRLVHGPGSNHFDIAAFIAQQPGYIHWATDVVTTRLANNSTIDETLTAAQVIERVSLEYSVDARLLLALLEYRAGWLSNLTPENGLDIYPMIPAAYSPAFDRSGLYKQLAWVADQLNYGYYGWKYRGWVTLEFTGGERFLYDPGLNAGTVGLQYFFSINDTSTAWRHHISSEGFYRTYYAYFGDPFAAAVEPLVPANMTQPAMNFPFAAGETWFFTGGAHGGWNSGSAWAAIDFAPPDESEDGVACFVSDYWAVAVAAGVIARSDKGVVVLDLDGDGDESTGWTVMYLHLAANGRVARGTRVNAGDMIGRPSCEGGFSTATHLHIARLYNGEWIAADCQVCSVYDTRPAFTMSGWSVIGLKNQEYQGYLDRNGERRIAEQGRLLIENRVSW